jgi:hypothetical protein
MLSLRFTGLLSTDSWTTTELSKSHYDWRSVSQSVLHDQIFITVWELRSCFWVAPSLTRGRVCLLYMLLVLASANFLGSESLGTHDYILLSQIWGFPFRRLLRLARSWWKIRFRLHTGSTPSHSHIATDGQSVNFGVEPHLGLTTRYFFTVWQLRSYILASVVLRYHPFC